jgi:hypothetical protein
MAVVILGEGMTMTLAPHVGGDRPNAETGDSLERAR